MIKQTLYFGNPAYLSLKNKQMVIRLPEIEKNDTLPNNFKNDLSYCAIKYFFRAKI